MWTVHDGLFVLAKEGEVLAEIEGGEGVVDVLEVGHWSPCFFNSVKRVVFPLAFGNSFVYLFFVFKEKDKAFEKVKATSVNKGYSKHIVKRRV